MGKGRKPIILINNNYTPSRVSPYQRQQVEWYKPNPPIYLISDGGFFQNGIPIKTPERRWEKPRTGIYGWQLIHPVEKGGTKWIETKLESI